VKVRKHFTSDGNISIGLKKLNLVNTEICYSHGVTDKATKKQPHTHTKNEGF